MMSPVTNTSPLLVSSDTPNNLDFCLGGGWSYVSSISYQRCFHSAGVVGCRLSALCFAIRQTHLYFLLKLQCPWDHATGPAAPCLTPSTFSSLEPPLLTITQTHLWLFWVKNPTSTQLLFYYLNFTSLAIWLI